MEHRYSPRTRVLIDVKLRYRGVWLIGSRTRDLGDEGLFVESRLRVARNAIVDIEFPSAVPGGPVCVRAFAVRQASDGVGLLVLSPDLPAFREVRCQSARLYSNPALIDTPMQHVA